jgi:N-methylhydantoinase A
MGLRVAIDIGGGFADLVALDEQTGKTFWAKSHVTPEDLEQCVRNVFKASGAEPAQVTQLLHGQTLVINAILQRRGAKVGVVSTQGFRDILALQRANRREIFNLRYLKPEPFVPRERRLEVCERTHADGSVIQEIQASEIGSVLATLQDLGVEAVAVSFINSYRNPKNEAAAVKVLRELGLKYVCSSSDISREWREYERTSTCVLNAYVMPMMDRYLEGLREHFRGLGMNATLYMMLSAGGVASFDYAAERPIETVESGPVAGVVGAVALAALMREKNIIALDGGSTTTKASLLQDCQPKFTTDYAIERDEFRPGYPIKAPVVDINEIGNGGASIAWLDETGQLRVGPLSAGARPGPACYGWGGQQPTLTDAYIAAGLLNSANFLSGTFPIRTDLAQAALEPLARHFGISVDEAAFAVIRVANNNAAQLLRLISVQRGFDPRDFTLFAYGGSGPLMAPYLTAELEIPRTVIPAIPPGNFSSWGLLMSDLRHTVVQTLIHKLDTADAAAALSRACATLEEEIAATYAKEGIAQGIDLERTADLRYYGQEHTINVPLGNEEITPQALAALSARFREYHEREYGFSLPSSTEVVNLRISGIVRVPKPTPQFHEPATATLAEALAGERSIFWGNGQRALTPIYSRERLPRAALLRGPAVIEEASTTILVPEGFEASLDQLGNIILRAL